MSVEEARKSVLIVEDEAVLALGLQRVLEASGFEVVGTVADASSAVRATQELRPSVVLMDIHIQGEVDGLSIAEELYVCENTPVVFLTAYSDEASLARAINTGAYGYLLKPTLGSVLGAALRIAMRKHQEVQALRCSTQWQRSALEHLGGAMIVTDEDGTVSFMNSAAEALTGWSLLAARMDGPRWVERRLEGAQPGRGTAPAGDVTTLVQHGGARLNVSARRTELEPDDTGSRRTMWLVRPCE